MAFLTESDLYTKDGLLSFQTLCLEAEACEPALQHITRSIDRGLSLRECMLQAPSDQERSDWAIWCRLKLATAMDELVRLAFSDLATNHDERLAAQLCIDRDDMGLDEAIVQLSRWHSAMRDDGLSILPVIEAELAARSI